MKGIYKFKFDCRRSGSLSGIFVAGKDDVENIIGKEVYFGEVLGKHSEVYGTIDENEISFVTDDPIAVEIFEKYNLSSGYNPFRYLRDEEE